VYYVAENGNDTTNNGSIGQPYLTISKALSVQDQFAYTTIYVAPGIYAENLYIAYPRLSIIGLINDTYRRQGVTLSGSGITTPLITYDPSGSGKNSIANFITVIENMVINAPSGESAPVILFDGSDSATQLILQNVQITTSSNVATSLVRTINRGTPNNSRISFINTNIRTSGSITSGAPLIDISGTVQLYLMNECELTGSDASAAPMLSICASGSAVSITNSSFIQSVNSPIITTASRTNPSPTTISNCYMLLNNFTATSPVIAITGSVGQTATPVTIRGNQIITTSFVTQSNIALTNGFNNLFLEKNLISNNGAGASYLVSGTATDLVSYSANTIPGTVKTYSPSILAAAPVALDTPKMPPSSSWTGPTGTFPNLAATTPGTRIATSSIVQNQLGFVWANATVSAISATGPGTMRAYIKIGAFTSTTMNYPYGVSGEAINCSLNYRTPSQIGPTGAIAVEVYGFDVNGPTRAPIVNQVNLFGLGNLT
jgi:hypothetical protein